MNELVHTNNSGKDVTTSLIVAEIFGKDHKNVLRDIDNMSCSESFRRLNFEHTPYIHPQNGQTYPMYEITKDGFSFLVMGYTGEKAGEFKEKFIAEFNRREALLKSDDYIIDRAMQVLRNRTMALEQQLKTREQVIKEMAPKALFADSVASSDQSILVRELAISLRQNGINVGQNRLFSWLRDNGYLCCRRGDSYNKPTQKAMDLGLFEVKTTTITKPDGTVFVTETSKVTRRGQIYFINKFLAA